MLTTPGGRPDLDADRGEGERGQRREFRRLQHHRIAGRERRRDLPGEHQQREIPRDDLPAHADGLRPRKLALDQRRPAGVMVEMAGDQRNVDVARLADRLAVVDRLQHRQESAPASAHGARAHRDASTARSRRAPPISACAFRAAATAASMSFAEPCETRAMRSPFAGLKTSNKSPGFGEGAVDEMPEAAFMLFEPGSDVLAAFGRGTVVHRAQDVLDDAHE